METAIAIWCGLVVIGLVAMGIEMYIAERNPIQE